MQFIVKKALQRTATPSLSLVVRMLKPYGDFMKYFYLFLMFIVSTTSQADAIKYTSEIVPKYYNDVWKQQYDMAMRIDYDEQKKSFDFYIQENLYLTGFTLTRDQADSLITLIDKYKEWNLKASKKGVTIEKEIGKFESSNTFWKIGNGDWSFGYGTDLSATFFSQTPKIHQLVVFFPKFKSKYNEYLTHKPETIYFSFEQAMKLRKALTKKSVQIFLEKAKKQAEIESEFN